MGAMSRSVASVVTGLIVVAVLAGIAAAGDGSLVVRGHNEDSHSNQPQQADPAIEAMLAECAT
jgi:hypothetical protein